MQVFFFQHKYFIDPVLRLFVRSCKISPTTASLIFFAFHLIGFFKHLKNQIGFFVFVWISFNFTCLYSPKFGILQMHKLWLNITQVFESFKFACFDGCE